MLIHVINLDRSPDRLAEFAKTNSHLSSVKRVAAVDGQKLDIPSLIKGGLIGEGLVSKDFYSVGAVGLALSHASIWQAAIDKNEPITAAEDDAILHSSFETVAPKLLADLPHDWDFILWGWNFDLFMCFDVLPGLSISLSQFEQERLRANIDKFNQQKISPQAFRLTWAFGTPCYSVTPKGAKLLKGSSFPLRPTVAEFEPARRTPLNAGHFRNVGIDSAMNNAYGKINAYVCFPPLVVTKNERSKSTIQNG